MVVCLLSPRLPSPPQALLYAQTKRLNQSRPVQADGDAQQALMTLAVRVSTLVAAFDRVAADADAMADAATQFQDILQVRAANTLAHAVRCILCALPISETRISMWRLNRSGSCYLQTYPILPFTLNIPYLRTVRRKPAVHQLPGRSVWLQCGAGPQRESCAGPWRWT